MKNESIESLFEKLLVTAKELDLERDSTRAQEERLAKAVAEAVRREMSPDTILSACQSTLTAARC